MLNISERQVNEGALRELEAANAETGSLNGVCTLPLSQEESLPCTALVQAFGALWCSGVWLRLAEEGLVWACKPCIQPSSQTLQSHEWRAFSLFTSQISRTKGAVAPVIKPPLWSLILPFSSSFKSWTSVTRCEHCHQQLVTAVHLHAKTTKHWKRFNLWNTNFQEFQISLSFCDGCRLAQEWYFCISIKKHLASQEIARNGWKMKILNTSWTQHLELGVSYVKSIVEKYVLFWQLIRPWSKLFCVLRVF